MTDDRAPEIPGLDHVRVLGEGGQAIVHQYAQRMPARQVAVKVLRDSYSPAVRDQFIHEANTMAALEHPHIVPVYFAGVTADQRPYLVMQYYPNGALSDRLRTDRFRLQEVLRVGIQVGSALETAHAAGVLHGDLKPHNILTNQYGAPGLSDFGIATQRAAGGPAASVSLPWAPPEALRPDGRMDTRSDIYSFAATLYHLLAGHSPFSELPWVTDQTAMMRAIVDAPVPPTGRPDAPRSLESLLHQGLAKDPALRPQSMYDLVRSLQGIERELHFAPTEAVMDLARPSLDGAVPPAPIEGTVLRPHADNIGGGARAWPPPSPGAGGATASGGWAPPVATPPGRPDTFGAPFAPPSGPRLVESSGPTVGGVPAVERPRGGSARLVIAAAAVLAVGVVLALVLPRFLAGPAPAAGVREVATISSKEWLFDVVQSPDGSRIYAHTDRGAIRVFDAATQAKLAEIDMVAGDVQPTSGSKEPRTVVSDDGATLYAVVGATRTLYEVDLASAKVTKTVKLQGIPAGLALDQQHGRALVATTEPNALDVVDLASATVASHVTFGKENRGVVFDATTGLAYVSDAYGNTLTAVDVAAGRVARVAQVNGVAQGLVVDSAQQIAYVGNAGFKPSVLLVDLRSMTVQTSIALDAPPAALGADFAHKTLFLTTLDTERLVTIDVGSRSIKEKLPIGQQPIALSYSASTGRIVVAEEFAGLRVFATR